MRKYSPSDPFASRARQKDWIKLCVGLSCLLVAICFSSCAIHPCGQADIKPKRTDFVFNEFKGKWHVYPVAVTPRRGSPILITHGLGGLDAATLEWAKDLGEHGWKVYLPLLDSDFDMCDPVEHSSRMQRSGIWKTTDELKSSGQVLHDMETLADSISRQNGEKRLVVVGNCLTGAFPLGLLGRRSVKTGVLCQPAWPAKTPLQAILRLSQSPEKRQALGIPDANLDASLDALGSDSSKYLYGFHYLTDELAPIDKFVWIHHELEKRRIARKFRPIVLIPTGSEDDQAWWERMDTNVSGKWPGPHVTLTGATEPDRTRLRKRFDQLIRP